MVTEREKSTFVYSRPVPVSAILAELFASNPTTISFKLDTEFNKYKLPLNQFSIFNLVQHMRSVDNNFDTINPVWHLVYRTPCNYLTATMCPNDNGMFLICAMKIAATASYNAVPSMLIVAPIGMTNLDTRPSTPILSMA